MKKNRYRILGFILCLLFCYLSAYTQINNDTIRKKNLYRPRNVVPVEESTSTANDRVESDQLIQEKEIIDTAGIINKDSIDARQAFINDSIEKRMVFIRDSIEARLIFIQDSIEKRQAFIRDSIAQRERRIDSLTFLKNSLPRLLEASLKATSEFVVIGNNEIRLEEDTALSESVFEFLPFNLDQPYAPWRSEFNFKDNTVQIKVDTVRKLITHIESPHFKHNYIYGRNMLIIKYRGMASRKRSGTYYNVPVDSVFYDSYGRISKIKRYYQYYKLTSNNKPGSLYFNYLHQARQYKYGSANLISEYEYIRFYKRETPFDPVKPSSIFTYNIQKTGGVYSIKRNQQPKNDFANGTFTYEYHANGILKSVAFKNESNTENWKTIIETNKLGNATRYIYENKGVVKRTMLINYYTSPKAKFKAETITCTFEKGGVCMYQFNNMTKKSRSRDIYTLEWTDWR